MELCSNQQFNLPSKLSLFEIALSTSIDELIMGDPQKIDKSNKPSHDDLIKPLLNSVLNYVSSLLRKSILPHRILRTFLFDIVVFAGEGE